MDIRKYLNNDDMDTRAEESVKLFDSILGFLKEMPATVSAEDAAHMMQDPSYAQFKALEHLKRLEKRTRFVILFCTETQYMLNRYNSNRRPIPIILVSPDNIKLYYDKSEPKLTELVDSIKLNYINDRLNDYIRFDEDECSFDLGVAEINTLNNSKDGSLADAGIDIARFMSKLLYVYDQAGLL